MRIVTALALVCLNASAAAQTTGDVTITFMPGTDGSPHVVDGDTFNLGGEIIRLWGIDAPDLEQPCADEGADAWIKFDILFTFSLLLSRLDECERLSTDDEGRTIAQCWTAGGFDIAELLVAEGMVFE